MNYDLILLVWIAGGFLAGHLISLAIYEGAIALFRLSERLLEKKPGHIGRHQGHYRLTA